MRVVPGYILLFAICIALMQPLHSQSEAAQNRDYYSELAKKQNQLPRNQRNYLQKIVQKTSKNDHAWLSLLDTYLIDSEIDEAGRFFRPLLKKDATRPAAQRIMAHLFHIQGENDEALKLFQQSLQTSPTSQTVKEFAQFLRNTNRSPETDFLPDTLKSGPLREQLDVNYALYTFSSRNSQTPLKVYLRSQHPTESALLQAAEAAYRLRQFANGDTLLSKSRRQAKKNHNIDCLTQSFILESIWQQEFGLSHQLAMLDSAEYYASRINNWRLLQKVYGERGLLHYADDDYAAAINQLRKAIDIADKMQLNNHLAKWLSPYGKALFYLESYQEALQVHERAEELATRLNRKRLALNSRINKGDLLAYFSRYYLAEQEFYSAYREAAELGLTTIMRRAYPRIGDMLLESKQFASAREIYRNHLATLHKRGKQDQLPYWLGRIAESYEHEQKLDSATVIYEQAFQQARTVNAPYYMSSYMRRLGELDRRNGRPIQAQQRFQTSLDIAHSSTDSSLIVDIHRSMGDLHFQLAEYNKAISAYQSGVAMYERIRNRLVLEDLKIGYATQGYSLHHQLAGCFKKLYAETNNPGLLDSLLFHMDLARGRTLKELRLSGESSNTGLSYSKSMDIQQRFSYRKRRWRALQTSHQNPTAQMKSDLLSARNALLTDRLRHQTAGSKKTDAQPLSRTILQTRLRQIDHTALAFHIQDSLSFTLIISPDTIRIVSMIIDEQQLTKSIKKLIAPFHNLSSLETHTTIYEAQEAFNLHQQLIKPLETHIQLVENILIIPDTPLLNLPFDLLLRTQPQQERYLPTDFPDYTAHLLVQKHCFTIMPDLQLPTASEQRHSADPELLVIANPFAEAEFMPGYFEQNQFRAGGIFLPLPFTEVEAAAIKALYPKTQVLKRRHATSKTLKSIASDYDIIHLATHAFADSAFDIFSGLVLHASQDSLDDGFLMGYEIEQLHLNCELVALSACETALGKQVAGEGVLGLPRLFLAAGAKSVLQTCWKVDDGFTSKLMPEFYKRLLVEGKTRPEALAGAKRFFLTPPVTKQQTYYQHPLYWASFNLFGSPGLPVQSQKSRWSLLFLLLAGVFLYVLYRIKTRR
ncbi:MAG: CHAT domain-containing protein [Calditrichia bacterium]